MVLLFHTKHMRLPRDEIYHSALRAFLRPIARYCLRRSIKLQDVVEALKASLLSVAQEEMVQNEKRQTVSRLSIMTGVHRKDVIRIIDHGEERREDINLPARIIGQWRVRPEFRSISGRPKTLSIEGGGSEFAALVRSVSKELNPYTVLFELERSGAVERRGDRLKLRSQSYEPKGDVRRSLEMLASDAEDLFEAVEENVFHAPELPNLHITTTYDNIAVYAVPKIREWFLKEGEAFHARAREFLSKYDRDSNTSIKEKEGGVSVSLGSVSRVFNSER